MSYVIFKKIFLRIGIWIALKIRKLYFNWRQYFMSQAVGITNFAISIDTAPKNTSAETLQRKDIKQSANSKDTLSDPDNPAGKTLLAQSPEKPFAQILDKKLYKRERIVHKKNSQSEMKQDLAIQGISLSEQSIKTLNINLIKNLEKPLSQKLKTTKIILPEKQMDNRRRGNLPSAAMMDNPKTESKLYKQSLKVGKDTTDPMAASKEISAKTKTSKNIESSISAPKPSSEGKIEQGHSSHILRPKSPDGTDNGKNIESAAKQAAIPAGRQFLPENQTQAEPTAISIASPAKSSRLESTVKAIVTAKQDDSSYHSPDSELDVKERKPVSVLKKQAISEQPAQKVACNAVETPHGAFRPISSIEASSPQARPQPPTVAINPADSSVTRITFDPSTPLSAAQQVLRGIQNSADSDMQTVHLALSPAGLGMVRIQLQREGNEISGILEVQKAEIRREIEKSLPQIVSILDSQGLQVRRIDVNPLANPNHKQQEFETTDQWALQHEMSRQNQFQEKTAGTPNQNTSSGSAREVINTEIEKGYKSYSGADTLNLYA